MTADPPLGGGANDTERGEVNDIDPPVGGEIYDSEANYNCPKYSNGELHEVELQSNYH